VLRLVPPVPDVPGTPENTRNRTAGPLLLLCRSVLAVVGAVLLLVGISAGWLVDALVQAGNAAYDLSEGGNG
jgi:hypothetical protein